MLAVLVKLSHKPWKTGFDRESDRLIKEILVLLCNNFCFGNHTCLLDQRYATAAWTWAHPQHHIASRLDPNPRPPGPPLRSAAAGGSLPSLFEVGAHVATQVWMKLWLPSHFSIKRSVICFSHSLAPERSQWKRNKLPLHADKWHWFFPDLK